MMMQSEVKPINALSMGSSVVRISGLPVVGNRLLQSQVPQISAQELKQLLDNEASNLVLVDVRYESEYGLGRIPGSVLVPYPEIPSGKGIAKIKQLLEQKRQRYGTEPQLIVICKAGVRSARAVTLLREAGIAATNLTGGIQAWRAEIDPSLPQYSIKDIPEDWPRQIKQRTRQRLLCGTGLVAASLTVAVVGVGNHPEQIEYGQNQLEEMEEIGDKILPHLPHLKKDQPVMSAPERMGPAVEVGVPLEWSLSV